MFQTSLFVLMLTVSLDEATGSRDINVAAGSVAFGVFTDGASVVELAVVSAHA